MLKRAFLLAGLTLLTQLHLSATGWADPYNNGIDAYNAHNYARAAKLLEAQLKQNPKDPNAVFYLGMAYAHTNRYTEARQAFDLVLQMLPPDHELATKARNNISYITKQQITQVSSSGKAAQVMSAALSRTSKDNYLTYVIPGGAIVHFSLAKMPLKVFIADGYKVPGWTPGKKQAVTYAMSAWSNAMHYKISFVQTYNESNADIVVRWQRNFTDNILGVSPFQTVGKTIVRSDIQLAMYYPDSSVPIPMEELKGIAVHEMGHAIGIRGHSPYPDDIMFYSKTRTQSAPSARDITTLSMLYKLDADVQNNTDMSTAQTRQYYDLYDKGLKAQTSNLAADAIGYYRQAIRLNSSMPEAKFNLGALLINEGNKMLRQGNLLGAKRNMEEAVLLYTQVATNPQAPPSTQDNLEIARNNLSIINEALKK